MPVLVQRGRNNPPVKKGSKAYCKSNIPSALEPPYFCLLALGWGCLALGKLRRWAIATPGPPRLTALTLIKFLPLFAIVFSHYGRSPINPNQFCLLSRSSAVRAAEL